MTPRAVVQWADSTGGPVAVLRVFASNFCSRALRPLKTVQLCPCSASASLWAHWAALQLWIPQNCAQIFLPGSPNCYLTLWRFLHIGSHIQILLRLYLPPFPLRVMMGSIECFWYFTFSWKSFYSRWSLFFFLIFQLSCHPQILISTASLQFLMYSSQTSSIKPEGPSQTRSKTESEYSHRLEKTSASWQRASSKRKHRLMRQKEKNKKMPKRFHLIYVGPIFVLCLYTKLRLSLPLGIKMTFKT